MKSSKNIYKKYYFNFLLVILHVLKELTEKVYFLCFKNIFLKLNFYFFLCFKVFFDLFKSFECIDIKKKFN